MVVPRIPVNANSNLAANSVGSNRQMIGQTSPSRPLDIDTTQCKTIESCDDEEFI